MDQGYQHCPGGKDQCGNLHLSPTHCILNTLILILWCLSGLVLQLLVTGTWAQWELQQLQTEGGKQEAEKELGINRLTARVVPLTASREGLTSLTLSSAMGTVWTGIGCQEIFGLKRCIPLGGKSPARLASALMRVRSKSVLRT